MVSTDSTNEWYRRTGAGADRLAAAFQRRVRIDLRALAAFRIALGSLLLFDLALRARNLTAFYTDRGVLPTAALYSDYSDVRSIHAWWGEGWIVAVLFLVAAAFAVAMLLGYRTRTVTLVSWILLVSLHNRNPMVLNGGDVMFRLLVFWGIFLPLGERWSLDARRLRRRRNDGEDRTAVATIATLAVLVQVVIMYVSNFVHKTEGEEWLNGEAVPYILTLDQFTVFLGPYLAEFPELLRLFTYAWLFLMALSPFLLLLTDWPRALLATGFVGMHVGMALTMQIGVFPLVVVAGLLLFYQPPVWDAATDLAAERGVVDRIRDLRARVVEALPGRSTGIPSVPLLPTVPGVRSLLSSVLPAIFLVLVLLSNAHALGYADEPPERAQEVLEYTETDQSWRLFAPNPLKDTRWFVANATLENGETVDAFDGSEVSFDRPPDAAERVGTARWRKYLSNVYTASNDNHESYLANYFCDRWNRTHDVGMESVEIHAFAQRGTPWGGESEVRRTRMIDYDCSGPFRQP